MCCGASTRWPHDQQPDTVLQGSLVQVLHNVRKTSVLLTLLIFVLACGKDSPTYSGPPIAQIVLSSSGTSVVVGNTLQFTTTVRDVNGAVVSNAPLQWLSSATNTATVNQNGLVTARAAGAARISARYGSVKDSVEIVVITDGLDVNTSGEVFLPFSLSVPQGATVRFNFTGEHDVHFAQIQGAPANILIASDVTTLRTFNTRGTFPYVCEIHPGMAGEIVVQ